MTPWRCAGGAAPQPRSRSLGQFRCAKCWKGGEKPKPKLPLLCVAVGIFASVSWALMPELVASSAQTFVGL